MVSIHSPLGNCLLSYRISQVAPPVALLALANLVSTCWSALIVHQQLRVPFSLEVDCHYFQHQTFKHLGWVLVFGCGFVSWSAFLVSYAIPRLMYNYFRDFYENQRVNNVEGDYAAGWGHGVEIVALGFPLALVIGPGIAHLMCHHWFKRQTDSAPILSATDEQNQEGASLELSGADKIESESVGSLSEPFSEHEVKEEQV